jgi:hypothetical protein
LQLFRPHSLEKKGLFSKLTGGSKREKPEKDANLDLQKNESEKESKEDGEEKSKTKMGLFKKKDKK